MDEKLEEAVLKTLAYSDIFDYPLRVSELHQYLIGCQLNNPLTLSLLFTDYHGKEHGLSRTGEHNGYFFLQGREKIVALRQQRGKIADEKMQKAKEILDILKHIPFIKMVAVTGAVAAGNAEKDSDIDVLIVAQKNRLWLARLTAILLLEIKCVRRRPDPPSLRWSSELRGVSSARLKKDKICLNMFISEENLELPHKDLFTANEFVRMKVVWEKGNMYERFIKANGWVKRFLPNWQTTARLFGGLTVRQTDQPTNRLTDQLEQLVRFIQLKYMERRKTTELITNSLLMFHPNDARQWVMREYKKRVRALGRYT